MARDHKGGGDAVTRADGKIRMDMLDWAAEHWRTPSDMSKRGGSQHPEKRKLGGHTVNLEDQAEHWSTPKASDGEKGGPNMRGSKGDQPLPSQAAHWPTPMAGAAGTETYNAAGNSDFSRKAEELAKGVRAFAMTDLSLPARPTPSGEKSSETRRRLNPLFVEWLMGWPEGLSGFDTAGMASCRSQQPSPGCGCMDCWLTAQRAMLSDLLTIEPPAQGALL